MVKLLIVLGLVVVVLRLLAHRREQVGDCEICNQSMFCCNFECKVEEVLGIDA